METNPTTTNSNTSTARAIKWATVVLVLVVMAATNPSEEKFNAKFGKRSVPEWNYFSLLFFSIGCVEPLEGSPKDRENQARRRAPPKGRYNPVDEWEKHVGIFGQVF